MSLDFKVGRYTVQTGKTFLDPSDAGHNFYTLKFTGKTDSSLPSMKASLRQDEDTYYADWNMSDNVTSYEGSKTTLPELECLLVYDEETQTFTLERPTIKLGMKKPRKKKTNGSIKENNHLTSDKAPPLPSTPTRIKSTSSPSTIKRSSDWLATPPNANDHSTQQRASPLSLALPPVQQKDTPKTSAPDTTDSFDVDLLSEMDEILNSNDEENDDDEEFETITSPQHQPPPPPPPIDQPAFNSPQPSNLASSPLTPNKRRRPALKMASAPIRRLDASPPTPAPQANKRPRVGGKTISAETLAARRKAASAIRSDSSSGSSSSGSSSDDDDTSGSSGSDSDSDMDSLAANISRGLSEEVSQPHYANVTPVGNGQPGPRSLRDLLDGNKRNDDDDVSSSGSSSDDDR